MRFCNLFFREKEKLNPTLTLLSLWLHFEVEFGYIICADEIETIGHS